MNTTIFYFFYNLSHQSYVFDRVAIFIADSLDVLVIGAALVYLFYFFAAHPRWKEKSLRAWIWECFTITVSVLVADGVTAVLKIIFNTARPFVAHLDVNPLVSESMYTSFPSGHATVFFALATALYLYNRKVGSVFFLFAVIIALSRMVVGVHYPIDILAGALIGVVVSYLFHRIVNSIFSRKNL